MKNYFNVVVRDDNGTIQKKYNELYQSTGLQKKTLAQRIFEEGMRVLERGVKKPEEEK